MVKGESLMKLKRLRRWARGWRAPPYKMIIFPTYRCNLNCPYCPFSAARKSRRFKVTDELSKEDWLRVVKQGITLGIGEWRIMGGGEPMMRADVVLEIVKLVKRDRVDRENKDCEIITNGTLFTEEAVEELVKFRLNRILFSIDGPSAQIHDSLRRTKGAFRKVTKTMSLFKKIKKVYGQHKPWVKVNMVVNRKNYQKLEDMVRLMKSLGCNELALHPMRQKIVWKTYGMRKKIRDLGLTSREEKALAKSIKSADRLASRLGMRLNVSAVRMDKGAGPTSSLIHTGFLSTLCFEPFYTIFIDPEGNAAPCNGAGRGVRGLNVTRRCLKDVWFSDHFAAVRKKMLARKPIESCLKCGLADMTDKLRGNLAELLGK